MFRSKRAVVLVLAAAVFTAPIRVQGQPGRSPSALTEEQVSVYRGFLDKLGPPLHIKNLASVTVPFDFKGFPEGRPCLKGIKLESPLEALAATHAFGPEIGRGRELRLVDSHEQMNLFRKRDAGGKNDLDFVIFSEIAFDTKHQFAVLKYILVSGEHSDSGATLVLEKVDGQWTPRRGLACAFFVNNSWSEMPD
jgi:hypothetical protein